MNYTRKIAAGILYALLPMTLFSFGILFSLLQVLGSPGHIKAALDDSGIYDVAVTDLIQEGQKHEDGSVATTADELPTEQQGVKQAVQKAFPPEMLQSQIGGVVDGVYAWLQGDSKNLSFEIDLSEAQPKLATYLADYAKERIASLPACGPEFVPTMEYDAFNAPCRPAGLDPNAAAEQTRQKVLQEDFLDDAKLQASDFKDGQGRALDQQLGRARDAYHATVVGIYISGVLTLLIIAGGILLNDSKRTGIRRAAIIVLWIGLVSTFLAWLSSYVITKVMDGLSSPTTDQPIQIKLLEVVRILVNDFRTWWMGFGIILVVLGVGALVALRATKPKVPAEELPGSPPDKTETPKIAL